MVMMMMTRNDKTYISLWLFRRSVVFVQTIGNLPQPRIKKIGLDDPNEGLDR